MVTFRLNFQTWIKMQYHCRKAIIANLQNSSSLIDQPLQDSLQVLSQNQFEELKSTLQPYNGSFHLISKKPFTLQWKIKTDWGLHLSGQCVAIQRKEGQKWQTVLKTDRS